MPKRLYRSAFVLLLVSTVLLTLFHGNILQSFQIFAQTAPTTTATISAGSPLGDNGWYVGGVTITLTANGPEAIESITFWLDSGPETTVNAATTVQTFSQNGNHTLYFRATDVNGVQESPTKSITFKVDTITPVNWSNITQTQAGNSHTFRFSVTITDATSGLDPNRAYIQYDVGNTGTDWGYYSDLQGQNNQGTQCDSTWLAGQWFQLPTQSFAQGATSGTIETPPIDYCNSTPGTCDFMKMRIFDMAGNIAERKICLGAPWLQTQSANVHSVANITMTTEGPQPNASYTISSQGTIASFISQNGWYSPSYPNNTTITDLTYATLNGKHGTGAPGLPSGRLPTTNGVFKVNGNFTVSSSVIPSGYSSAQNFGNIILVNGTLTINTNIVTHATSAVVFVANGGINVRNDVTTMHGVYSAGGLFDSSYNANSNVQLRINGAAYALGGFDLARSLGTTINKTTPAELIVYQPQYFLNKELAKLFAGTIRYDWREVLN